MNKQRVKADKHERKLVEKAERQCLVGEWKFDARGIVNKEVLVKEKDFNFGQERHLLEDNQITAGLHPYEAVLPDGDPSNIQPIKARARP